jgi:hypothetical protein
MAISLSAIAAKARAYPSRAASFGAALCKLAESVKATTDSLSASITALTPSHVVKFAGKHTITAGEDTAESAALSVAGVLATDIVMVSIEDNAGSDSISEALPSADTITIAGTLTENTIISYVVYRALS